MRFLRMHDAEEILDAADQILKKDIKNEKTD